MSELIIADAETKLAKLFGYENINTVAYKLKLICLHDTVRNLLNNKPYTAKELCKILDIKDKKLKFNVSYYRRAFLNPEYWKQNKK